MASGASNWSVVGKTKKGKPAALTKTQKKNFIENMPRIDPLGMLKCDYFDLTLVMLAFGFTGSAKSERMQKKSACIFLSDQ